MRKPVLIAVLALVVVLALGVALYIATRPDGTSSDDPLVRQSYANGEYSQTLLQNADTAADSALQPVYDAAVAAAASAAPAADTTARHVLSKDGAIALAEGASVTMVSGEATLAVTAGAVSDVTAGEAAADGAMAANHRYIVCTGGTAAVTVTQRSVFVCSGSASVTAGEIAPVAFTDVKAGSWYYDAVSYLAGIGLLGGVSATSFAPNGTLTLAQALTLSASLHQYSQDGKVTLKADKDIWYMSYVEYAVSQGVVDGSYAGKTTTEYNAPVTRAEFVHILYGALPEESYTVINSIGYDAIPDVRASQAYADEIYAFYRAGIITGGQGNKFDPSGTITRSAVAVIMANMLDPGQRQSVTLK